MSAVRTVELAEPISTERDTRWAGIKRNFTEADVGTLLHERDYVHALGALTGNMAVQQVRAGLEAIYLSGWQVAADANSAGQMYPDQGLYPVNSVPEVVRAINGALLRADQIDHAEGNHDTTRLGGGRCG